MSRQWVYTNLEPSPTFSWFHQINLAEGRPHKVSTWLLTEFHSSHRAVLWLPIHPLQWPRSRWMSLDECPGLFQMTSQRKASHRHGNCFPRTATSSTWLLGARVIISKLSRIGHGMAWEVLPHPLPCDCPRGPHTHRYIFSLEKG